MIDPSKLNRPASTIDLLAAQLRELELRPDEDRKIVVQRPATGEFLSVTSVYIYKKEGNTMRFDDIDEPIPEGSIVLVA